MWLRVAVARLRGQCTENAEGISPPLAAGRLQILEAEQVAFSLKSVWSDGTYQIVLSPDELLEGFSAL